MVSKFTHINSKQVSCNGATINILISYSLAYKLATMSLDPLIAALLTLLRDFPKLAHVISVLEIINT